MSFVSPDRLHATFAEAFAAADVDALVDLYEEVGAIRLQPDDQVLSGPDALRRVFDGLLGAGLTMRDCPGFG